MQPLPRYTFAATPDGILANGLPLDKNFISSLPLHSAQYVRRAKELLATVKKEDWDGRTPHDGNHVSALVHANMMLALASPIVMAKAGFNSDQPRDSHGRWADEGSSGSQNTGVTEPSEPAVLHVLQSPHKYVNSSFPNAKGNAECVAFAQQMGGAPVTNDWVAGDYISPGNPPPVGTWVATFDENGHYYGHVGAFSRFGNDGTLYLYDQFNKKGKVTEQHYSPKPQNYNGKISNDPSQYRIVKW